METQQLVYLGTPVEAVEPLRALHRAGYEIPLVITRADARRGRRGKASASPVKEAALEMGLKVEHSLENVATCGATRGVVVAFGQIIPASLLARVPMVNLHFSKLPRWRGAAPIERAILAGDTETAVAIMEMEAGLDTGPVHAMEPVEISQDATADSLREKLVEVGTRLLVETLNTGMVVPPVPQEGEPIYAAKITSLDRALRSYEGVDMTLRRIRIGRAWTIFRGERFIIWRAVRSAATTDQPPGSLFLHDGGVVVSVADGAIELLEVQPAGKSRMESRAWWNGVQPEDEVLVGLPIDERENDSRA
ncbi:MAG: methionyl-tRNA formyltransferase [Acidimicrobiales bacterium]|nr:methionyl-tRNA formyltransferase [Acidimicrobiales bacterium]